MKVLHALPFLIFLIGCGVEILPTTGYCGAKLGFWIYAQLTPHVNCDVAEGFLVGAHEYGVDGGLWREGQGWDGYTIQFINGLAQAGYTNAIGVTEIPRHNIFVDENYWEVGSGLTLHELIHATFDGENGRHCHWATKYEPILSKAMSPGEYHDECEHKDCKWGSCE